MWIVLSVIYVAVSRLGESPIEPVVFVMIAVILIPIVLARTARLTGKEKIRLTQQSLKGPRGFVADIARSIEEVRLPGRQIFQRGSGYRMRTTPDEENVDAPSLPIGRPPP